MALSACDWEIRTDGDDGNGGGFERGASGTDYSQQAAAQKTGADLEVHASTNTDVKPTAAGVAAADIGNLVRISAGTDWTAGWYSIKSIQGDYWRLDRSPSAAANENLGTYKMGGALASIGGFGAILAVAAHQAAGHTGHVRSGTYLLGSASDNVPGGSLYLSASRINLMGYDAAAGRYPASGWNGTRPIIKANGYATANAVIHVQHTSPYMRAYNIEVDCETENLKGFQCTQAGRLTIIGCKCSNSAGAGLFGVECYESESISNAVGLIGGSAFGCVFAHNSSDGSDAASRLTNCILAHNGRSGSQRPFVAIGCIAFANTSNGFGTFGSDYAYLHRNLSVKNGYGYTFNANQVAKDCYAFGNVSGATSGTLPEVADVTSLTANPFLCPISDTGFAYTQSTKTLTKAGAFSDIASGDSTGYRIRITSGTNMTPGTYWIASKTSDDAVVLATDAGTGDSADAVVDYDFSINNVTGGGATLRAAGFQLPGP